MRIKIAEISGSHGVRGLVKLKILCENLDLFNNPVFVDKQGDKILRITLKSKHKTHFLAEIQGITNKNESDALRGTTLFTMRESLPEPDEDEIYLIDLIGRMAKNEQGEIIGEVIDTHNFGASDLLEIKPQSGESFFLPYTDDYILDVKEEHITISEIEYV
tara:strand:- start:7 stop:489 length:483 start_codon:yes stop_codon:yes gene_type:complete